MDGRSFRKKGMPRTAAALGLGFRLGGPARPPDRPHDPASPDMFAEQ